MNPKPFRFAFRSAKPTNTEKISLQMRLKTAQEYPDVTDFFYHEPKGGDL